jgi:uncharacterized membrane protein
MAYDYSWPVIILISGGLAAMLAVFATQVQFANQNYGNFP